MPRIHACLLGEWVCLNDDPNAFIGDNKESPNLWYKQNAELWAPNKKEQEHTYYQLDYVKVFYKGVMYRINPIFIQLSHL